MCAEGKQDKEGKEHISEPWLRDEKEKRAEILMKQLELGYTNFDRRRTYEWKLSLAIWTALAAFIALSLKGTIPAVSGLKITIFLIAALGIVSVHVFFLVNLKRANDVDKAEAYVCEDELNIATGTAGPCWLGTPAYDVIGRLKHKGWWAPISQIAITIILILCSVLVIKVADEGEQQKAMQTVRLIIVNLYEHAVPVAALILSVIALAIIRKNKKRLLEISKVQKPKDE